MPIRPSKELIANVICVFMRKAIKIPVIMGIINVLAGFVLGETLNIILGTIFLVMSFIYWKKVKNK